MAKVKRKRHSWSKLVSSYNPFSNGKKSGIGVQLIDEVSICSICGTVRVRGTINGVFFTHYIKDGKEFQTAPKCGKNLKEIFLKALENANDVVIEDIGRFSDGSSSWILIQKEKNENYTIDFSFNDDEDTLEAVQIFKNKKIIEIESDKIW